MNDSERSGIIAALNLAADDAVVHAGPLQTSVEGALDAVPIQSPVDDPRSKGITLATSPFG